jgi:hypothetical protein
MADRPGREFDHSPSCSTNIKNEWSYTSPPSIRLHCMDTETFTFNFIIWLSTNVTVKMQKIRISAGVTEKYQTLKLREEYGRSYFEKKGAE